MAIDNKGVISAGYWLGNYAEFTVRVASYGYIGTAFPPPLPPLIAANVLKNWLSLSARMKCR